VPAGGTIIANADEVDVVDVLSRGCWTPVLSFARLGHAQAPWQWEAMCDDGSAFRLYRHGKRVIEVEWQMIGIHNVANACAVAAAASTLNVDDQTIARALASFSGIRRRMSLVGEVGGVKVFDDFAHHPTAIAGMVSAAKASMPEGGGELWVIVEPRSNTMRTRIHQDRLPLCFDAADHVIFAKPSSRNLQPQEVLDAQAVCDHIVAHAELIGSVPSIVERVSEGVQAGDHVLVLSNGGFDGIHQHLLEALGVQE